MRVGLRALNLNARDSLLRGKDVTVPLPASLLVLQTEHEKS